MTVAIPATAWGTISMQVEGMSQEFRATSEVDIPRGQVVHISGVAGNGLIVEPATPADPASQNVSEATEESDPSPPATT